MDASYLKEKHEAGLSYADYLAKGTDDQRQNWSTVYNTAELAPGQKDVLGGFTRRINVLAVSGIWCGDCVQQGPLVQAIAEATGGAADLRWLDRDEHIDLQEKLTINAGNRVPVVLFCAEDYELVSWYGDKTLTRYRAMAAQQLHGAACPLPGAPVPEDERAGVIQEWVNEFERVHLLLRLSGRLRQLHGD